MIRSTILQNLSLFILALLFVSCSKDVIEEKELSSIDHFVELSEIEEIASGIQFPEGNSSSFKSTGPKKRRPVADLYRFHPNRI